jgi:hypothetical protein
MNSRCIWILETPSKQQVSDLVSTRFPLALEKLNIANNILEKSVKTVGGGRLVIQFSPFQIRAEFWPAVERSFSEAEKLAVMCGQHSRLGKNSLLRLLDPDTVRRLILNVQFVTHTRNENNKVPLPTRTRDETEFCSFLTRFTEGEEAVVDNLFLDQNDDSFYNDELNLWFHVAPESMPDCMHYVCLKLDFTESEKDQSTGETSMWLYALLPEDGEHGTVYFHFNTSSGLIIVSGLGAKFKEERVSLFSEPGVFEYFVDRLQERIQETKRRR